MRFELRAITADGRIESVDLQALDESGAREQAQSRGLTVLAVRRKADVLRLFRFGAERFPLVLFSQELLVLIGAGLPLVEALDTLAQKERRSDFRTLLERIVAIVREGRPLSWALEQFPGTFPPLYVAMVRAAEKTSDLGHTLARYVAYQNQLDAIRKRVKNASIYPLLLLGVGALVSLFLLFYVVPRFSRIYEERGVELPLVSRVLVAWGRLVEGHGMLALVVLAAIAAAVLYVVRLPAVRAAAADMLWKLPGLGERMKTYQLARFYRTIGMLLKGGTPLVAALGMGSELLQPALRTRLAAASRSISEGRGIAESLERNGLTTAVALRMLGVGEHGGDMGEMMDRVAAFHDEEIGRWVDAFTRLFEPLLMTLIGLVIGAVVVLMYMPIFELAGSLQ